METITNQFDHESLATEVADALHGQSVLARFDVGPLCRGTIIGSFWRDGTRAYICQEGETRPTKSEALASFPLAGTDANGEPLWDTITARNDDDACTFTLSAKNGSFWTVSSYA